MLRRKENRGKDEMGRFRNPYTPVEPTQCILRDELAMDRTDLANERTLLAYVRTALALLLAGVSFVYFSRALWFSIVGAFCLFSGAITLGIGARRYWLMKKTLRVRRRDSTSQRGASAAEADEE